MSSLFEECLASLPLTLTDVGVSVKALAQSKRVTEGDAYLLHSLRGYVNIMLILLCTTSTSLSFCE